MISGTSYGCRLRIERSRNGYAARVVLMRRSTSSSRHGSPFQV
jgi:hypothetical protein